MDHIYLPAAPQTTALTIFDDLSFWNKMRLISKPGGMNLLVDLLVLDLRDGLEDDSGIES